LPVGTVFSFSPPAVPVLARPADFSSSWRSLRKDVKFLIDNLNKFLAAARKRPEIGFGPLQHLSRVCRGVHHVDRDKVLKQGVAIQRCYQTIQAFMGGLFVNYFMSSAVRAGLCRGRSALPLEHARLGQFYVRTVRDRMAASALANFETRLRPGIHPAPTTQLPVAAIIGSAAPGYSSEQATAALEDVCQNKHAPRMGFDYMGMSYQEQKPAKGFRMGHSLASRCFPYSGVRPRCMRAGRFHGACSLSTPVALFGPSSRSGCAALCSAGFCRRTWFRWRTSIHPDWV